MIFIIALIALALAFDFLNGLHDAANSIATVVSTRLLSPAEYTPEILAKVADARCPISGKPVDPKNLAVAAVGSRAAYLCHYGHIVELTDEENAKEDEQVAQEGGNGGGQVW